MRPASGVTVRGDLRTAIGEYSADLNSQFMADFMLPIRQTNSKSAADIPVLKIENVTKGVSTGIRSATAGYDRVQSEVGAHSFNCSEKGFEEVLDEGFIAGYDDYFDAELAASRLTTFRLLRAREIRTAAKLFSTSNFSNADVTTEWSNIAAKIFEDVSDTVLTIKQAVGGVIGQGKIVMGVSEKVFKNILKNTDIIARLRGGSGSTVNRPALTTEELAFLLEIDEVNISAAQNGGADIWDDEYAFIGIKGMTDDLSAAVQYGRTFLWTKTTPTIDHLESYEDDAINSTVVRARHWTDENIITAEAGYLLKNITA